MYYCVANAQISWNLLSGIEEILPVSGYIEDFFVDPIFLGFYCILIAQFLEQESVKEGRHSFSQITLHHLSSHENEA